MNLNIRLITEENKVYLSVEGNIPGSTMEEKRQLSQAIHKTICLALKLETDVTDVEIVSDFVRPETPKEAAPPKVSKKKVQPESSDSSDPGCVQGTFDDMLITEEKDLDVPVIEDKTNTEPEGKGVVIRKTKTFTFGKYSGLTPAEILRKDAEKGLDYFKWCLEKADKVKNDPDMVLDIELSTKEYVESIRDNILAITSQLDEETANDLVNKFFAAHGSSLEAAVGEREIKLLNKVYSNLEEAQRMATENKG